MKHYYESGTVRECPLPGEMPIERTTIYSETFPPTPGEKCLKEERHKVKCSDFIEPLFPHSHFAPLEYGLPEKFVWLISVWRKGTNQNGTEQRHFTE